MAEIESIKFAGQVIVEDVTITTQNGFIQTITNQVAGIQIFEDIFSPFITGNIIIYDVLDLTNLFPFVGEEFLQLKIRTPSFKDPSNTINARFYIYKLSDKEMISDASAVYRLHFISIEAIVDINKKISQCFEGRCSDLVENIISGQFGLQSFKKSNIEPTPNGIKFISNYWSPVKNIEYISERSINNNNSPSYLFFENRNGLNFVSLDSLYTMPVLQTFEQNHYTRQINPDGSSYNDINKQYQSVVSISIPEGFDYMSGVRDGAYASKQISYDVVTKKYSVKAYDLLSDYNNNNHLNPYPLISEKSIKKNNSTIFVNPKAYGNFNNFGDVTDTKVLQKRTSLLKRLDQYRVNITVAGRTDYTVGQKVDLLLYKNQPITERESNKDLVDKVYSGSYIISAINHFITRKEHTCSMELIKESSLIDLNKGK